MMTQTLVQRLIKRSRFSKEKAAQRLSSTNVQQRSAKFGVNELTVKKQKRKDAC
ncbi:hypothetical protein [Chroogloeocystis siderophila]|uniref:hypothetical protein n=1 Tax=Chroogloeocystis siderophila TaxID=329163 RepID=UPI0015BBD75B|nr:hypothetical protein [Chroogloeocystis siderophila]